MTEILQNHDLSLIIFEYLHPHILLIFRRICKYIYDILQENISLFNYYIPIKKTDKYDDVVNNIITYIYIIKYNNISYLYIKTQVGNYNDICFACTQIKTFYQYDITRICFKFNGLLGNNNTTYCEYNMLMDFIDNSKCNDKLIKKIPKNIFPNFILKILDGNIIYDIFKKHNIQISE